MGPVTKLCDHKEEITTQRKTHKVVLLNFKFVAICSEHTLRDTYMQFRFEFPRFRIQFSVLLFIISNFIFLISPEQKKEVMNIKMLSYIAKLSFWQEGTYIPVMLINSSLE